MILLFLETSESPHCDIICTVRANAGVKIRQIWMKWSVNVEDSEDVSQKKIC